MKIATISMACEHRKIEKIQDNLEYIEKTFEEISNIKPDLVCLPEIFYYAGVEKRGDFYSSEIKVFLKNLAKKYKTCIAGSIYDEREKGVFNTCVFINREGEIIGKYDKIHPTESEIEDGIIPGSKEQKVVETEFGYLAAQICFDANWFDEWKKFSDMGAKLIVFSSSYPGGKVLNSISLLNSIYIVASIREELKAGIIDNTGRWIVKTNRFSYWVWCDINLERTVFHWDFQGDRLKGILKEYRDKIKIETFGDEALFTIEPISKDVKIDEIIKKYKLITYKEYIKRATEVQDDARTK